MGAMIHSAPLAIR